VNYSEGVLIVKQRDCMELRGEYNYYNSICISLYIGMEIYQLSEGVYAYKVWYN